uniref:Uncharacterized protein n=1 Tax=Rhizophora mucronata TaxID=61149 RepID=A0A2P2QCF0_RHIMU
MTDLLWFNHLIKDNQIKLHTVYRFLAKPNRY